MPRSRLILASSCLAALFSFARCAAPGSGAAATGGSSSAGGSTGPAVRPRRAVRPARAVRSSTGGSTGTGGMQTTGTGGTTGKGGTTGTGGSSSTGGTTGTGGTSSTGGSTGTGGSSSTGGTTGTGGSPGTGGNPGIGRRRVGDGQLGGMALAKPAPPPAPRRLFQPRRHAPPQQQLGLRRSQLHGHAAECLHQHRQDDRLELQPWELRRANHSNPDFPEVEFGVAPFGNSSSLLTSPAYSSTTLLPIQLSALNSASVTWITSRRPSRARATGTPTSSSGSARTTHEERQRRRLRRDHHLPGWNASRQTGSTAGWTCQTTGRRSPAGQLLRSATRATPGPARWRFFNFNPAARRQATSGRPTSRRSSTTSGASTAGFRTACT